MAGNPSRVEVNVETILKGLGEVKALREELERLSRIKVGGTSGGTDRGAVAAQKLAAQIQEVENRQRRAAQAAERLNLAQARLDAAHGRAAQGAKRTAVAHDGLDKVLGRVGGSLRNLGLGLTSLGSALTVGLTAPLAALGVISTQSAVSMDSLKLGLKAVTGSAAEAEVQLGRLTEIAKLPGIGFQEAIQGSIRLQALGINAEVAERALKAFANAVALTGGGRENLDRLLIQLTQLISKGKVLQQDLRFIIENAPATGKALRDAFGTVNPEEIEALGLTTDEFLDRLFTGLEGLPRAAAGARNTLDNFADAVFRITAAIGEGILPVITKLIETFEPLVTSAAEIFRSLPKPVQAVVVVFGALLAAAGPVLFVFGQFSTGIGGLISAFGRLNALGLLPTILNFRLLGQVMVGTASLAAGSAATTAAAAAGWAALGASVFGIVGIAAAAVAAFSTLSAAEEKAVEVDIRAEAARVKRISKTREEIASLEGLAAKASLTAEEQDRLRKTYDSLEGPAGARIKFIDDEAKKLRALIEARRESLRLDEFAAKATAAQAAENVSQALQKQREAQEELNAAQRDYLTAGNRALVTLAAQGDGASGLADATAVAAETQRNQNAALTRGAAAIAKLVAAGAELGTVVEVTKELAKATGTSTDELLRQAQDAGKDAAKIDGVRDAIANMGEEQRKAVSDIDEATAALERQRKELERVADSFEKDAKARRQRIENLRRFIIETSGGDTQAALRQAREFLKENFQGIADDIREETGKGEVADAIDELFGLKKRRGVRGENELLRAGEQFAQALAETLEAGARQQEGIQKNLNDAQLRENETAYALQLRSLQEYLETRHLYLLANVQLEKDETERAVKAALAEEKRLREAALKAGPKTAAGVRFLAGAQEAETKRIEAQTKLNDLRAQEADITAEVERRTREHAKSQQEEINKLTAEYEALAGSAEEALNLQTAEKYREKLQELAIAQEDINKKLASARQLGNAALITELEAADLRNRSQKEVILGLIEQERALNSLKTAEEFITRARQRQSDLERQISFDVEHRGQAEEEAIRRRLEGEEKLKNSLLIARDIALDTINQLREKGLQPPQAMIDFVNNLSLATKGLGELPFSEQFRLAQQEFDKLNDERIRKIEDVERAVRHRDIAEIEGRLLVRKINGEYVADLEKQLQVLRAIAAASGDRQLQQQADSATQATADVRAATDEFADFNQQLRSTSIDAFRDSTSQFFRDLRDQSQSATEDILNFLDRIGQRITDLIAENLADQLIASLLGDPKKGGGLLSKVGEFLGLGGPSASAGGVGAAAATAAIPETAALGATGTTAAAALNTGAATAAASLSAGGAAAGASFTAGVTAAGAGFATTVAAAGAAFAASVAAAGAASAATGAVGGLGSAAAGGFAFGGQVPLRLSRGERYVPPRIVKNYGSEFFDRLNRKALRLSDRMATIAGPGTTTSDSIPAFAPPGSFIVRASAAEHEARLLDSISEGRMAVGGMVASVDRHIAEGRDSPSARLDLKHVLVDSRSRLRDEMMSSEGRKVLIDVLGEEGHTIRRRWGWE